MVLGREMKCAECAPRRFSGAVYTRYVEGQRDWVGRSLHLESLLPSGSQWLCRGGNEFTRNNEGRIWRIWWELAGVK